MGIKHLLVVAAVLVKFLLKLQFSEVCTALCIQVALVKVEPCLVDDVVFGGVRGHIVKEERKTSVTSWLNTGVDSLALAPLLQILAHLLRDGVCASLDLAWRGELDWVLPLRIICI